VKDLIKTVKSAQKGDDKAFERLYQEYAQSVHFLAVKQLKNDTEAEDITQEVFIAAYRNIGNLKDPQSFPKWLHTIAVNKCSDALKKRKTFLTSTEETAELEFIEETNGELAQELDVVYEGEVVVAEPVTDWNKYSVKNKILDIGRQVVFTGLGAAAEAVKQNTEDGENSDIGEIIGNAIEIGTEAAKSEVKAVVAGAIKTAAVRGVERILPENTDTETICDIAGFAVEGTTALTDAALGKTTLTEAMDNVGRAGVAAAGRIGAKALKGTIASIPVVGPAVSWLMGGLFEHMETPKFQEGVYTVVRDAAKATWNGIKQKVKGVFSAVKNALFN